MGNELLARPLEERVRLSDALNLSINDLNFADEQIERASAKHDHFRIVPFPKSIHDKVRHQIEVAESFHRHDATNNPNGVPVPYAYARKCPSAPRDIRWMWLFPSETLSRAPADGHLKRYHSNDDHQRRIFATLSRDLASVDGLRHTMFGGLQQRTSTCPECQ
jgi:integrase